LIDLAAHAADKLIANMATFFVRLRQIHNSTAGLLLLPVALASAFGSIAAGYIIKRYVSLSFLSARLAETSLWADP
jgi:hypothetical protein